MRLRRIEAARFGRLFESSLAPLGDGLTIVEGPNEAGKSSFTALVRYLLYGFPSEKRGSGPPYLSDAGKREGRLVFEAPEGEWVIERTEGVRGGPVVVRTVRGADRPGLLDDLTHGVTEQAFRVVFGFGLAEMAQIETLRGTDDDIVSSLYAAGAGLGVSPQEVRASFEEEAAQLYRRSGSKPVVNALIGEAREIHKELVRLEREAAELASDSERLQDLSESLDRARSARDDAAAHHRTLLEEMRRLEALEDVVRSSEEELLGLRRAARTAAQSADDITVDTQILDASADIVSLADELSAFRKRLADVHDLEAVVGSRRHEAARRLEEAGLDVAAVDAVDITPETRDGVQRLRDELLTAEQEARRTASERDRAADEAAAAAVEAPGATTTAPARATDGAAWLVVGAVGIAIVALGALAGQWMVAGAGAFLALLAGASVWRSQRRPTHASGSDPELARLVRRAEETRLAAERAEKEVADVREGWTEFRNRCGLGCVTEPPAAARVLETVTEYRRLTADAEETERRLAGERRAVTLYVERVARVAEDLERRQPDRPAEVPATVERLKEALALARDAAAASARAAEEATAASTAVVAAEERQKLAIEQAKQLIDRLGVEGGLAELRVLTEHADAEAGEAQERWGALKSDHAALEVRIGERERQDTIGIARLALEGVRERIAIHAERYVTLALAAELLARAQERYEKLRQPAVVQEAARIFDIITRGAYPRLSIPLGASAIQVFDASVRAKETPLLSTGTAEQLYLALRLALIGQLGERGAGLPVLMDDVFANFDPERKRGAAEAVAELAQQRQVIVFTCHPETAAVLTEAEPAATTLSLDRC